jgi:hypothetical protein
LKTTKTHLSLPFFVPSDGFSQCIALAALVKGKFKTCTHKQEVKDSIGYAKMRPFKGAHLLIGTFSR